MSLIESAALQNTNTSMMAEKAKMADLLTKATPAESSKNLTMQQKAQFAKVAQGFESMFVSMMMKGMKEAMLNKEKTETETFGAETLQSHMDLMLSDQISKTGSGIGIAKDVYSFLSKGDNFDKFIREFNPRFVGKSGSVNSNPNYMQQIQNSTKSSKIDDLSSLNNPLSKDLQANFETKIKDRISKFDDIIEQASHKFGVPQNLIKAVISAESAGKVDATSKVGAKGLMQLMDATAKDLGVENSYDPEQNIMGGAKYLSMMLGQFDGNVDKALAAYNAGPSAVEKYSGIPPYKETQSYLSKVKNYKMIFEEY